MPDPVYNWSGNILFIRITALADVAACINYFSVSQRIVCMINLSNNFKVVTLYRCTFRHYINTPSTRKNALPLIRSHTHTYSSYLQ